MKNDILYGLMVLSMVLSLGVLFLIGLAFVLNFLSIYPEKINCKRQAEAMGFGYDFKWYIMTDNICTYIMKDGKRVISTKYRAFD